jgi:hypothetical protein
MSDAERLHPLTILVAAWDWSELVAVFRLAVPRRVLTDAAQLDVLAQAAGRRTFADRPDIGHTHAGVAIGHVAIGDEVEALKQMRAAYQAGTLRPTAHHMTAARGAAHHDSN